MPSGGAAQGAPAGQQYGAAMQVAPLGQKLERALHETEVHRPWATPASIARQVATKRPGQSVSRVQAVKQLPW